MSSNLASICSFSESGRFGARVTIRVRFRCGRESITLTLGFRVFSESVSDMTLPGRLPLRRLMSCGGELFRLMRALTGSYKRLNAFSSLRPSVLRGHSTSRDSESTCAIGIVSPSKLGHSRMIIGRDCCPMFSRIGADMVGCVAGHIAG